MKALHAFIAGCIAWFWEAWKKPEPTTKQKLIAMMITKSGKDIEILEVPRRK